MSHPWRVLFGCLAVGSVISVGFWVTIGPPGLATSASVGWYLLSGGLAAGLVFLRPLLAAIALLAVDLFPLGLAIALGFINYSRLDSASFAVEDWKNSRVPTNSTPLLVHISDTHFIGTEQGKTREGNDWDVTIVEKVRTRILELRPRFVILSGDVTDRGTKAQWAQAEKVLLAPLRDHGIQLILVAGNHDLQPFFEDEPNAEPHIQLVNFVKAQALSNGAFSTPHAKPFAELVSQWKPPPPELADQHKKVREEWGKCTEACSAMFDIRGGLRGCLYGCEMTFKEAAAKLPPLPPSFEQAIGESCEAWHPLEFFDPETNTLFLTLCSCVRLVHSAGTNAVGEVGSAQLDRLKHRLNAIPEGTRDVFVVLHHPVVKRPGDRYGFPAHFTWKALSASSAFEFATLPNLVDESRAIVNELRSVAQKYPKTRIHLAFGHRHGEFLGKVDQPMGGRWVSVSEAPAAYDRSGGMWIAYGANGSPELDWRWWSPVLQNADAQPMY